MSHDIVYKKGMVMGMEVVIRCTQLNKDTTNIEVQTINGDAKSIDANGILVRPPLTDQFEGKYPISLQEYVEYHAQDFITIKTEEQQ